MIGAAKTAMSANLTTPVDYSCFITPGYLLIDSTNGAITTSKFNSTVLAGVGPFTYEWSIDNGNIHINTANEESTSLSTSGYNTEVEGILTLTVTDTGDSNKEATDTSSVSFFFGDALYR